MTTLAQILKYSDVPGTMVESDDVLPISNQERRKVQRRAMAGFDPTKEQAAGIEADAPRLQQNSEMLADVGAAGASMLLPFGPAAKAIQYAPRVTGTLAGILGLTGGSVAPDSNETADLKELRKALADAGSPELNRLNEALKEARSRTAVLDQQAGGLRPGEVTRSKGISSARTENASDIARLESEVAAERSRVAKEAGERADSVMSARAAATTARDFERSKAPKPFMQWYEQDLRKELPLMPPAWALPMAAGAAGVGASKALSVPSAWLGRVNASRAIQRGDVPAAEALVAQHAPAGASSFMKDAGTGAVSGFTMGTIPLAADRMTQPAMNPEKAAQTAYSAELLDIDPRKAAALNRAANLPDRNPALAATENWRSWALGMGAGAIEGASVGKLAGAMIDGLKPKFANVKAEIARAKKPADEVVALSQNMDRSADAIAGKQVSDAKRIADTERSKAFYGSDEYGDQITKGLSAREEARLSAAEVQRRGLATPDRSGAPAGAQPPPAGTGAPVPPVAPVADLQPRAATAPNQAGPSSSPVTRLDESTASALPNQPQNSGMITADPNDLSKLIRAAIDHFEKPPLAPVANTRAIPPPKARGREGQLDPYNTPVQGPAGSVSPAEAARDVYLQAAASGKPTTGRGGSLTKDEFPAKVTDELRTRTGVDDATGLSKQAQHNRRVDAEKQIDDLAKREGISYQAATQRYYDANPLFDTSTGLRRNVPALAVGGLAVGATLDRGQEQSILDEVMKQYMGGRGLDQITASDVQGKIEDQSAVDGVLGRLRGKVGGLATKGEQLRAIRDVRNGGILESDTSPTGYRDPSGRFATGDSR